MASYSCVSGFGLSGGDATRTCEGDGSSPTGVWSGVVPSCGGMHSIGNIFLCIEMYIFSKTAITCTSLNLINNGLITFSPDTTSPFNYGTTATHSCNQGFYLVGNIARNCVGDGSGLIGTWSGSAPVCAGECAYRLLHKKIKTQISTHSCYVSSTLWSW